VVLTAVTATVVLLVETVVTVVVVIVVTVVVVVAGKVVLLVVVLAVVVVAATVVAFSATGWRVTEETQARTTSALTICISVTTLGHKIVIDLGPGRGGN